MIETINYTEDSPGDIFVIDDKTALICNWVFLGILCQIINMFGIVTNIINIVCFVNQGFKESVNITLLGLSVADLGSLKMMIWSCICVTPAVIATDLPFDPIDVCYLTTGMIHFAFTRVSSCITAMLTIERCLCITAPFKIKSMITPRRATVIIVCIYIVIFCGAAPVYTVNKLEMKFSPVRNKSIIGLVYMKDREIVDKIYFIVNNFSIPLSAFVVIILSTIILSIKLKSKIKWRIETTNHAQSDRVNSRNQKTAKMVVMMSTLFIICFIPICISMLAIAFVPALTIQGKYFNITLLLAGLGYVTEGVNSSMNIFIYYNVSSKYRDCFSKLFFSDRIHSKI